jgi:hypothetical protein
MLEDFRRDPIHCRRWLPGGGVAELSAVAFDVGLQQRLDFHLAVSISEAR